MCKHTIKMTSAHTSGKGGGSNLLQTNVCTACILTPFESHTLVLGTLCPLYLSLGSPYGHDPKILWGSNHLSPLFS